MNKILHQCRRLLTEMEHLSKMNKNNKFKMAAAAILSRRRRSLLCTQAPPTISVRAVAALPPPLPKPANANVSRLLQWG